MLVLPGPALPPADRPFRVSLRTGDRKVWESGSFRSRPAPEGDLAIRLPAGIPPGRYDVLLSFEGEDSGPRLLATLELAGSGN